MPWKNGGGTTAEIASGPPGSTLDSFDWRISMAQVASDGPFSSFPGIDRTLAVIEGAGLRLTVDGQACELTPRANPFSFRGEAVTHATRMAGNVTDLNVMTRRERYAHRVRRIAARGNLLRPDASIVILFCGAGNVDVANGEHGEQLRARDSLFVEPTCAPLRLNGEGSMLLLIEILARAELRLRAEPTAPGT
jgi:hypothetical protein